jgi:hypothetical protein
MKKRWLPVGIVALALFAVNVISRVITVQGKIANESQQVRIGFISMVVVGLLLIGASAWWSMRYPIGRVVADLGAATGVAALASCLIGPLLVGSSPFHEGLGLFVGQLLLFAGLGAVGVTMGFLGVVTFGKDWKSKGLKRYSQTYLGKPRKAARG